MKKFMSLMLAGVLMCQGGAAFASTYYGIEDERNNSFSEADDHTVWEDYRGIYGLVSANDTADYFKLTAMKDGEMEIRFYYDNASSDIDIDLFLYDQNKNKVGKVLPTDGSDRLYAEVKKGDVMYLYVDYDHGYLTEPYKLKYRIR